MMSPSSGLISNQPALQGMLMTSGDLPEQGCVSRKSFGAAMLGCAALVTLPQESPAFQNRIAPKKYPAQPGPQPQDLGLKNREKENEEGDIISTPSLKFCGEAPNCFSSADKDDKRHYLPPYQFSSTISRQQAFNDVVDVIKKYEPGQNNVDGGGFEIKSQKPYYVYAQFESLKHAYIDDVEFYIGDDNFVQVRTSSRLGFLDFQTNAKRINAISSALARKDGWKTTIVDEESYPWYYGWNADR
uniref:DUF1499 domain-containing protein n=1 Tax=Fibrocapsa japonica TaxID=94617 RepID=A0A7S2V2C7_9STRA